MRPWSQVRRLIIKGTRMILFIVDRYSDLRHGSGFEPPPSKRVDGNFIEDPITGALCHHRIGDFAARSIDSHDAITASGDIRALCLVWILWQVSAQWHGLGNR